MLVEPNRIQLLLNGAWNPRIFTPPWVQRFLFESNDPFDVLFNIDAIEFGFSQKFISIYPSSSTIKIVCNNLKVETMEYAKKVADRILQNLQHTPVDSAVIELSFELKEVNASIETIQSLKEIKVAGYGISAFKFIKIEPNILNKEMFISLDNSNIHIQFLNKFNRDSFLENSITETVTKNKEEVVRWVSV